ncbi:MAG: ExbD/TolR family protein [Chthoniobacteraceae bacterium]
MKLTRTVHFHPALFHVLPLVNVLFLVLAIFALSSRFVLQPGISVALPVSPFTLGPQQNTEIVSVTATPTPTIFYKDGRVTLEELGGALSSTQVGRRALILKADRMTPYDLIVQITNIALRQGFSVVLATAPEPR